MSDLKNMEKMISSENSQKDAELETKIQYEYMDKVKRLLEEMEKKAKRKFTFHVCTFGCQMNARDSEKLSGILETVGYQNTETEDADFVIYNTCTVRENANNKVYGRLGALQAKKRKNPHMMIALCGCMMQEKQVVEKIKTSYSFVNLIFGTHNLFKFPELLYHALIENKMTVDVWDETDEIVENLPVDRKYSFKSGVNIMFGCNNFCSYCIVPYVRGRERSREPKEIIREIEHLADDGVIEIMLLGQNVNSYGKNLDTPITFAELLKEIIKIDKIQRIRFMTSHPKDLSDELIEVMASSPKICRHLHLPMQSGSTKILQEMNRHYTKEEYLNLVKKIKTAMPDISLTTDIIVGFPGETEEDFKETLDVVEEVQFDSAFTFIYSKRSKTKAAEMPDQVPEEVIKDRFDRLLQLVQKIGRERTKKREGMVFDVLVEQQNDQDETLMTGRLSNNEIVHFPGNTECIGKILPVRLTKCQGFYYLGEMV